MDWWLWILLGLALLGAEMATPGGFYVLFFGAAALVVGALVALGAAGPVAVQWLLFSLGSIGALVFFRQRLLALFKSPASGRAVDSLLQDVAILLDALPPDGVGRAELRGTTWTVRNGGARALPAGQRCRVDRIEGLTLWVRAE